MKRYFNLYGVVLLAAVTLTACQVMSRAGPPATRPDRTAAATAASSPGALASLTPMPTATPTPTPPPTSTPIPTPTAAPTAVPDPTAEPTPQRYLVDATGWRFIFGEPSDGVCPEPTDETRLLHNARAGYCLLYPDSHMVLSGNHDTDATAVTLIVDSIQNTSDPYAFIRVGPLNGRTIDELAEEDIQRGWEIGADLFPIEVGGHPGYLATGMPGQNLTRSAWFATEDSLYSFGFGPDEYGASETNEQLTRFIEAVLDNFTPLAPAESQAAVDECMQPRTEEQLIIEERLGICLLLPAAYAQESLNENEIVFRPGVSGDAGDPVLTIKVSDDAPHRSADRAARELAGLYPDESTRTSCCLALDDESAYVVEGDPSIELGLAYLVIHRERLYTITLAPWDPTKPEHATTAAALDHLLRQSFRFLP